MDVVEGFLFYITTTKLSNLHCSCTWGLYEVHNFLLIWKIKGTFEAVLSKGGTARDLKCCIPILTAKHIPNIVEFLIVTAFQCCIPRLYEVRNICSSTSQSDGKGACRASDPELGGDVHHSCTHKLFC